MSDNRALRLEKRLKSLLAGEGYSLTAIVKELNKGGNMTSLQNISNKLKRGTLNFTEVEEIIEKLGYKVEFVKEA